LSRNNSNRGAFSADHGAQTALGAAKAAWWGAAAMATRAIARSGRTPPEGFAPSAERAPEGFVRKAWSEAFEKDARDVALGLYPPMGEGLANPVSALLEAADLLADARRVEQRRLRGGAAEVRDEEAISDAYPNYYRQNFHFQSDGWFTAASARRYRAQVEALFAGAAAAMRRRALSLLAAAWRDRDHRGAAIVDVACGSGGILGDLAATFPRASLTGLDLSFPYLEEARRRTGLRALAQANAERLPIADGRIDAVTCVYLFHELPPVVRPSVARELARVLAPGGLLAFADSIQPADEPRLARLLEAFPAYFHEPYYASYSRMDLPALFADAGLTPIGSDRAFLTKALLFQKG
jgi:ubiquinone/menaquinone biosynthesis C-methylase UbiE